MFDVIVQHAGVPVGGHSQESSAGGAVGSGGARVLHRGGGGEADDPQLA